jgi:MSHA biogenesis protein MshO
MVFSTPRQPGSHGFTLVELLVVMTILGILAALGGMFVVWPVRGFFDLSRRATLVDTAENALRRMQRDIRLALPNSVRIAGSGLCLEILLTDDGGRYRARGSGDPLADPLDFTRPDTGFDVLGNLSQAPSNGQYLVVYNLTSTGTEGNAYRGDNRAVVATGSTAVNIKLNPAMQFPRSSPYQRFFLLDGPVSYVCDLSSGTLTRHSGYSISASQPVSPGGSTAVMARHVRACSFSYQPGTSQRAGLVTLSLQVTEEEESITLLHQVHVENAP